MGSEMCIRDRFQTFQAVSRELRHDLKMDTNSLEWNERPRVVSFHSIPTVSTPVKISSDTPSYRCTCKRQGSCLMSTARTILCIIRYTRNARSFYTGTCTSYMQELSPLESDQDYRSYHVLRSTIFKSRGQGHLGAIPRFRALRVGLEFGL